MKNCYEHGVNVCTRIDLLKKLGSLLLITIISTTIYAQKLILKGTVTDQSGVPMIGVNLVVKGTTNGTVTNFEGQYTLTTNAKDTLLISYIGYKNQIIPINKRTTIDITLEADLQNIDEIVVVGYGVQKKSDVTGSVASIKAEDLEKTKANTIAQAMQGRAAGVQVTSNSGSPGSEMTIRVRGTTSINGSNPLYVVDGMPLDDINHLNPSDIESMEILKDASACAIYGARGANGVILITTKKGKNGEGVVSFEANYSINQLAKKIDLVTADEFVMLQKEAYTNAQQAFPSTLQNYAGGPGTDWQDAVSQQAFSHNHNVSFIGGNDKMNYFLSLNNTTDQGIIKKSNYQRSSLRLNTSFNAKKWLRVGQNISVSNSKYKNIEEGDDWTGILVKAINIDPTAPVKLDNGKWGPAYLTSDINNPLAQLENTYHTSDNLNIVGNVFAEFTLFQDFVFKTDFGINQSYGKYNSYLAKYFVKTGDENAESKVYEGYFSGGAYNWTNYATYTKKFDLHNFTAMFGNEIYSTSYYGLNASGKNMVSTLPDLANLNNATETLGNPDNGDLYQARNFSYLARLNYAYNNKYLATINYRIDGSSKFAPENRYGQFKSFSLGWKISDESFMDNITLINNLKLRAGYGEIGNDQIGTFGYLSVSSPGRYYVINNENVDGTSFPRLPNTQIQWETVKTTNLGIDLALYEDQITMALDLYNKQTSDMLIETPVPAHVGTEENPWTNFGSMSNKGLELELSYKHNFGDFNLDVIGNFDLNRNELTNLGESEYISAGNFQSLGYVTRTQVGHPVGAFYGYITDGLFQTQEEIDQFVNADGERLQPDAKPGDIKYADSNNDGVLDQNFLGSPHPDYTFGLTVNCEYRGFDFSMFVQGVQGNEVFNGTKYYTHNPNVRYNLAPGMVDRWMAPGTQTSADYPRLDIGSIEHKRISDRYIEDGSFIRIKNIQIGYNLPEKWLNTAKISSARVYVGATNLYTFTNYTGFDPEVGYTETLVFGLDRINYPQPRVIMTGISLKF